MKALAVGLTVVATSALALGPGTASARASSRLMVSGDEYSLVLSRQSVARGPALVQFVNRGEDAHDLKMRRIGANSGISFPEVRPLRLAERSLNLGIGRYRLWCSLSDHSRRGMRATLTVRR